MGTRSAGILMYHHTEGGMVVLLVHPGGPFWRNRDLGAWSIPKGEYQEGEDPQIAARREFAEELGVDPKGPLRPLGKLRQRGGKIVVAYALEGTLDVATVRSNKIAIEWPPRSGRAASQGRPGTIPRRKTDRVGCDGIRPLADSSQRHRPSRGEAGKTATPRDRSEQAMRPQCIDAY